MNSKKYNNIKLGIGIAKTILTFILILLFVELDYSKNFVEYITQFTTNSYLVLLAFVVLSGLAMSFLFFPVNYYTDFLLEHKYKLSNQSFFG